MSNIFVIHIPERCVYNPFIDRTIEIQERVGIINLRPGICNDGGYNSSYDLNVIENLPENVIDNLVIHFHWPEKLYCGINEEKLLDWVKKMKERGVRFVKTIHNLKPHEQVDRESEIVGLMDGIVFFSNAQKEYYMSNYNFTGIKKVIPHPNYHINSPVSSNPENKKWKLLCVGRVREYKQLEIICEILRRLPDEDITIRIAGKPDEKKVVKILTDYSIVDSRLHCDFEFLSEEKLASFLYESDAVLLPYTQVWSSGVAILCANYKKPLIGKIPYMFRDYQADQIGVFDSTEMDMNTDMMLDLILNSIKQGKEILQSKALNLHHLCENNSDKLIGIKYKELYSEVLYLSD